MPTLDTPLSSLPTVRSSALPKLKRLGLTTVGDLLYHFPTRYEDYATAVSIAEAVVGDRATFEGELVRLRSGRTRTKKVLLTEATLSDGTGELRLVWFNQKFLVNSLRLGARVRVSGTVESEGHKLLLTSPAVESAARAATHTGRIVPVYPETAGLTSKFLRWQLETVFRRLPPLDDPLPSDILARLHLPSLRDALRMIHFPKSETETVAARKRFAFQEMFLVQLKALETRTDWNRERSVVLPVSEEEFEGFRKTFPFPLTGAQTRAVREILADLAKDRPMNRLLNGDVGSGKTLVAAHALIAAARAGYQAVLLAPTEVLARQHFETLRELFSGQPFETALLTREYQCLGRDEMTKAALQKAVQAGIARVIVATHAVLQQGVRFHNLTLVIVDEQHRFGVVQRAYLQTEAKHLNDGLPDRTPHFLTMTATPIPRTLAMAFFGNLDISLLDEMPRHRKPIKTVLAKNAADREKIYGFVRSEIEKGRQAFIILPLVEESKVLTEVKAATEEHARLAREIFPELRLGLLHGRLKAKEKEKVMADFKDRKLDILVATAVVEVGIDIPNASVMLIEEAERFGLSQLHQFRGRVGRGEHQSYCFLLPGGSSDNERLQALEKTASGFELAEVDLRLRGPGAIFGTAQSGFSDIALENLANVRLVTIAQEEAARLLDADPGLGSHPLLAAALKRFDETVHWE